MSWRHQMPINFGSKRSLVTKFGQFMQYYKIIFLSKNSTKNVACELGSRPFLIFKESCKKDSVEVSMLIWTNIDRFTITYLI